MVGAGTEIIIRLGTAIHHNMLLISTINGSVQYGFAKQTPKTSEPPVQGLKIGTWDFFGPWCLDFGAYLSYPPIYPSHRPKADKHSGFCMSYPSQHPSQTVPEPSHPSQAASNGVF